jgi:hypothetical protein
MYWYVLFDIHLRPHFRKYNDNRSSLLSFLALIRVLMYCIVSIYVCRLTNWYSHHTELVSNAFCNVESCLHSKEFSSKYRVFDSSLFLTEPLDWCFINPITLSCVKFLQRVILHTGEWGDKPLWILPQSHLNFEANSISSIYTFFCIRTDFSSIFRLVNGCTVSMKGEKNRKIFSRQN